MYTPSDQIHPNIRAFMPMVEGITKLFHPYAEGAIHDLRSGKIVALYNNISKRSVGDHSAVAELGVEVKDFPDFFEPYYKTNWDGSRLKCTSITVRDEQGKPIGLICINFATTDFETMSAHMSAFLALRNTNSLNPVEQFAVDWQKQVTEVIDNYVEATNIALKAMGKTEKSELVKRLYSHGLFNYRDAAAFVAKKLNVSRTTVYNYLKDA